MTREKEIEQAANGYLDNLFGSGKHQDLYVRLFMAGAQWADEQQIEQLTAFAQHLNKRGAFRDDLCMDIEHEAQSFIEMQNNKEL